MTFRSAHLRLQCGAGDIGEENCPVFSITRRMSAPPAGLYSTVSRKRIARTLGANGAKLDANSPRLTAVQYAASYRGRNTVHMYITALD
jgi:hypothetical protein